MHAEASSPSRRWPRAIAFPVPLAYTLTALASLLLAAHFLRTREPGLLMVAMMGPWALLSRRRWVLRAVQLLLLAGVGAWIYTARAFVMVRALHGEPWTRLAIILSAVALLTAVAAYGLSSPKVLARFEHQLDSARVSTGIFVLTALLLGFVHVKVKLTMILLERFAPGWGWVAVLGLAIYGAWVGEKMLDRKLQPKWRGRIWTAFSAVFFTQFILGLAGFERFLQTGKLHMPIPALIVGGPVYRGEGFFMLILFFSTILFVGPAWCSHLCYIGAWDHLSAKRLKRPTAMPRWRPWGRYVTLALVLGVAWGLRAAGLSGPVAVGLAGTFGLAGVGVMLGWSRKTGVMTHCTTYCPVGLLATRFGKLNPFRITIDASCTNCMACTRACRFDALGEADVQRRKPGPACTLCGDCVPRCKGGSIDYRLPGVSGPTARAIFVVLVIALHAATMGLARI